MEKRDSRSWREYILSATCVSVRTTPGTWPIRRVTMSASSSCSRARTIAMKSIGPVTEYTSDTPSTAARASPRVGIALRSAEIKTTAVITALQALHVDVVERGLEVVGGLLEGHRLAAVQRGFVAVEAIGGRALVVPVEGLLELIDGELHPVPRGGADHGHPPDDSSATRISGGRPDRSASGRAARGGGRLFDDLVAHGRVVHLDVAPAVGAHVHVRALPCGNGRVLDRRPLLGDLTRVHGGLDRKS